MVKRWLFITLGLLLVLAAILLAVGWWVLSTPQGSRWLLAEISRRSAVTIDAQQIEGRLRDRLRLVDVRVHWPQGEASLENFELRWRPASLLHGRLDVDALTLTGGEVVWKESPAVKEEGVEDTAFAWPRLSGWPLRLQASIAELQIEDFELRSIAGEVQRLERLTGRLDWRKGTFSFAQLDAAAAGYRLQGEAAAGFEQPLLRLDLQMTLPSAAAGMDGISLQADLVPEADGGLAGPLVFRGSSGGEMYLQLATDLALRGDTLRLRHFELNQAGRRGTLSGEGEVRLADGAPRWSLHARIADLDLKPETGVTTDIAGTLEGEGEGAEYRGSFDLTNRATDWRAVRLAGPFAGSATGVAFPQLAGSLLRGELTGSLDLDWQEGFSLAGSLRGRRLEPAAITPEWPGQINLDLTGDLAISASSPLVAHLNGRLLDSTLRDHLLTGKVEAELAGSELRLAALELHGDGFDLSGSGRLAERIDFNLVISRLSGLVPGAQGNIDAQGWLRWRDGQLAGELNSEGRQIGYADFSLASLQLVARQSAGGSDLKISLQAAGLSYDFWQFQRIDLEVGGNLRAHRVDLRATWPKGYSHLLATGGWREGRWSGILQSVDGKDAEAGSWRLQETARIEVAADHVRIDSFRLSGSQTEWLQVSGQVDWGTGAGDVAAKWEQLALTRLDHWLPDTRLSGDSSGEIDLRWRAKRPLEMSGTLSAAGDITFEEKTVAIRHLAAKFSWSGVGLQADLSATLEDGGGLDAGFTTSEPLRTGFPRQGEAKVLWADFDLSLFDLWLKPASISGRSSGDGRLRWQPDGAIDLAGRAEATGRVAHDEMQMEIRRSETTVIWNADGLQATLELQLQEGGRLSGRLHSAQEGRLALPERGSFEADWAELDLTQLQPWLPEGIELAGRLGGETVGDWQPGGRLTLAGKAAINKGNLSWRTEDGEVTADLRSARLAWDWRGEALSGSMELVLAEGGEAKGDFRLPLPARLPVAMNPAGSLQLTLAAKARELGLLSAAFPGLVQKSRGELEAQVQVAGTWQEPRFSGTVRLAEAGAYFPAAGIELRQVTLDAELAGDELRIVTFSAHSGPGQINGSGSVHLQHWKPVAYRGTLKGERFEAVHLPELELLITPDLTFEGTAERLQVRGEVRLPELTFIGREQRGVVRESPDVVIISETETAERSLPFALDIQVHVILGDHVLIQVAGVDARLIGDLNLRMTGPETITGNGEISVAQGIYSTYGAQLKIERGRLLFSGGPIDRPTFDILALRTVGEVKAGVQVSGTPRVPVVKLYSEPAMPDTDVLSYIVLGQPLGDNTEQAGLLSAAAGALLARGESAVLQNRIKRQLGVDVFTVESGGEEVGSMVTIGKYLSPSLFLSFGQSIFTNASEARLRYTISKRWELVSKVAGERSGVDLYYKIEFE